MTQGTTERPVKCEFPFFPSPIFFKYNVSCYYSDNYDYNLKNRDKGDVDSTCKSPSFPSPFFFQNQSKSTYYSLQQQQPWPLGPQYEEES